jgi:hypothetical protein
MDRHDECVFTKVITKVIPYQLRDHGDIQNRDGQNHIGKDSCDVVRRKFPVLGLWMINEIEVFYRRRKCIKSHLPGFV